MRCDLRLWVYSLSPGTKSKSLRMAALVDAQCSTKMHLVDFEDDAEDGPKRNTTQLLRFHKP
jgi:hypothetical protein